MTNTDSYTIARCFAAGGTLAAILAWPMSERYGAVAGVSWLLVAVLGLFGAWYDQRVVRRSKQRRRLHKRFQQAWRDGTIPQDPIALTATPDFLAEHGKQFSRHGHDFTITETGLPGSIYWTEDGRPRVWTPHSVIADLLIQEDHRRIRHAEETK